ncbi:MAG: hypothetical protein QMD85_04280, partial [Candidatus Aenigmarchaeota archaeon]|nr:hypothetical protein [Candidatus Aenigmarchaeota archaeon]MDI6722793.1 hypothetical protein [Candidatus Aenigmarchaeota archaeon]
AASFAETTGQLNITTSNASIVTGLFGYTVDFCNTNGDCFGYKCFLDWDGVANGGMAGWCNLSSVTNCYSNGTATATGSSFCITSASYRACTNGAWGNSTSCSSGQTCSAGSCISNATSSSSSSSSSGGGTTNTSGTNFNQAMSLLSSPSDFNITQGMRVLKNIIVKNTGNRTLFNVTANISGIEPKWVSIGPNRINITINSNATFGVEFIIPSNATPIVYDITANVTTSNSSVKAYAKFRITILPTNETVQKEIIPSYNDVASQMAEIDRKIKILEDNCTDTKVLKSNGEEIRAKLKNIEEAMQNKDYIKANALIGEAKSALNELNQKISGTTPEGCKVKKELPVLYIIIVIAAVGIGIILIYLFWPTKAETGYAPERGWTPPKEEEKKKEFAHRFRRKK